MFICALISDACCEAGAKFTTNLASKSTNILLYGNSCHFLRITMISIYLLSIFILFIFKLYISAGSILFTVKRPEQYTPHKMHKRMQNQNMSLNITLHLLSMFPISSQSTRYSLVLIPHGVTTESLRRYAASCWCSGGRTVSPADVMLSDTYCLLSSSRLKRPAQWGMKVKGLRSCTETALLAEA